ncbi:MAG: 2Fe-2S iron-sulfur cluster binding domain-containing protein [Gammaproteobacteria bacterium]|nr:2Fe-2S iron-sulfur cluster binding domain-containing protein [Gammaproteobacteria bacterium]
MPSIIVTNVSGETRAVEYTPGFSLMEALREADFAEILAICGGSCSCATCHVHIPGAEAERLPNVDEDEQLVLELADHYDPAKSRLSCQIELTGQHHGMAVTLVDNE